MPAKSFVVKRDGEPTLAAIGFPADMACKAFVNVRVGDGHSGEFQIILYVDDARAFAAALNSAINHADQRFVEAAELIARAPELKRLLTVFATSYAKAADPIGDSDLDNEQPRHVTVTLGDCRRAAALLGIFPKVRA